MIAAIYARKSTPQRGVPDTETSCERQVENAKAFAARKGWAPVRRELTFTDHGVSGAETTKLLAKQRLMALARARAFHVVIMQAPDRFSRRDGDEAFGELKELARYVDIWFYAKGERFTYGDFKSNVSGFLESEFAAEFRRVIAAKTYEAMRRKAEQGWATGKLVYGYTHERVDGHSERRVHPAQAAVIRDIYARYLSGVGTRRLAQQLNADRIPASKGRTWTVWSVHDLLSRELYRGTVVWNRTKTRNAQGQKQESTRPVTDHIRVEVPALRIIDDDVWDAVQQRLQAGHAQFAHSRLPRDRDSAYLLSGFGQCAICRGGWHVRRSRRSGKAYYACSTFYNRGRAVCTHGQQYPMEALDREVLGAIQREVLQPAVVDEIVAEARALYDAQASVDTDRDTDQHREELEKLTGEQARLTKVIRTLDADVPPELIAELRANEQRRRHLKAQHATPTAPRLPWRAVEREVRNTLRDWRTTLTGDVAGVRGAFRTLLPARITFTPTDRGLRFEGRMGLRALLHGECVSTTSPSWTPRRCSATPTVWGVTRA